MAAAAEKRMASIIRVSPSASSPATKGVKKEAEVVKRVEELPLRHESLSKELSAEEANKLFVM
ncbi:protein FAM188A-like, partial [Trifolium medium]|nr:protein FAM188A-like [Trifolium medium]